MKQKPVNPYERLRLVFAEYVRGVEYPHTKFMWRYPKMQLGDGWNLTNLAERVAAADQLGYDVLLQNDEEGLRVMYRKKRPDTPWEAR